MKKAISWVNGSQWWSCHLLYVFSPKAASFRPTAKKKVFQGSAPVYRQGYVLQMRTPHPPTWSATSLVVKAPQIHPYHSAMCIMYMWQSLCQSGNPPRCFHLGIWCDNDSIMQYSILCCSQGCAVVLIDVVQRDCYMSWLVHWLLQLWSVLLLLRDTINIYSTTVHRVLKRNCHWFTRSKLWVKNVWTGATFVLEVIYICTTSNGPPVAADSNCVFWLFLSPSLVAHSVNQCSDNLCKFYIGFMYSIYSLCCKFPFPC